MRRLSLRKRGISVERRLRAFFVYINSKKRLSAFQYDSRRIDLPDSAFQIPDKTILSYVRYLKFA